MRRMLMALTAGVIAVPAAGIVACKRRRSRRRPVPLSTAAKGGAFCGADDTIDRDTANVDSAARLLKALQGPQASDLTWMESEPPLWNCGWARMPRSCSLSLSPWFGVVATPIRFFAARR